MVIAVEAYRLAYMALPKAACSSVKAALARLDPAVSLPQDGTADIHVYHRIYPTRRFRPHRWEAFGDHFRFCVLRDPAERLMSVYTNRVLDHGDLKNSRRMRRAAAEGADLPPEPDADTFFQRLEAYKARSSSIRHHAMAAWLFLGRDLGAYDRLYDTTELDALAADLGARCGHEVTLPRRNPSRHTLSLGALRGETIDALRPFLDQEYAYYSGRYRNPLGPRRHRACAIPAARVS